MNIIEKLREHFSIILIHLFMMYFTSSQMTIDMPTISMSRRLKDIDHNTTKYYINL